MPSRCNYPSLAFTLPFPIALPGFPALPSFGFPFAFALPPCPLD
jgi:hypothetical protein